MTGRLAYPRRSIWLHTRHGCSDFRDTVSGGQMECVYIRQLEIMNNSAYSRIRDYHEAI